MVARTMLACGFLLLTLIGPARADGCYIPEKAIQKLPEIPAQRALLSFRDGKETLIVESALEGPGKRFGWVIPVPAKPEAIEAATPGTMKSLAMGIQPEIVHDLKEPFNWTLGLCLLGLIVIGILCWGKRTGRPVLSALATVLLLIVLVGLVLPSLMAARRGSPIADSVSVLDRGRVGSYEVAVLAAADAEALYAWLKTEDLAIPGILRPAVDAYAKAGWCFVTAKLATDGSGQAVPHPLRISFKTDRAVYPMKLTGLSGRALDLELYVVGDQGADVRGMKRIFCDQFFGDQERPDWPGDYSDPAYRALRSGLGQYAPHFHGENSGLSLGHPGFLPALWNGCWVSKLASRIPSGQMNEDYHVTWSEPRFGWQKFYSRQGAGLTAGIAAAICFCAVTAALLILWAFRKFATAWLLPLLVSAAAVGLSVFGVVKLALPQVETSAYGGRHTPTSHRAYTWWDIVEKTDGNRYVGRVSRTELAERIRSRQPENVYTGQPAIEEDSPGNYNFGESDGKPTFTMYDLGGTPVTVELGGK